MSRKIWVLIFLGVLALHAGFFLLIKDGSVIPPQWLKDTSPPAPTFIYDEAQYTDPDTGQPMKVQEFTVPTRLADGPPVAQPVKGDK